MSKDRKCSLKSKFADSQPALIHKRKPHPHHKVRLMDLCPQQKAKVGQLMQLMQNQRQQNLTQSKLLKQYEQGSVLLKDSIQELTNKVSEQEELIARLTEELRSVRKEIEGKDREMEELASMYESYINREVRAVEVQTLDRRVLAVAVQTEEGEGRRRGRGEKEHRESHSKGKAKTKNIKIQTDYQEEYVPVKKHSKSFERVMKSHIVNSQHQDFEKKGSRPFISEFQKQYQSNQQPLHTFEANTSVHAQNDDDDVEIAQLTKAWASLKKHQASEIPKKKVNFQEIKKSRSSVPSQPSHPTHPSQLQYSSGQASPTKLLQMYNQLRSASRVKRQPELDQEQLNKMLKSGDFRAKQALQSVRRTDQSQSQHKTSKLDFYQTNLLDLVNSIAK